MMSHSIDGSTAIYGILGNPVSHSLSPLIHNAAFEKLKINAVYVPFPVEKASKGLGKAIMELGIRGVSVTIPHKGLAARWADVKDPLTAISGAANTLILNKEHGIMAHNTDGPGALEALRQNDVSIAGKRILIIGYGGSATAIAHSLLLDESPTLVAITGRNRKKREEFANELSKAHSEFRGTVQSVDPEEVRSSDIDLIIHTTPLGMKGQSQELPMPSDFFHKSHTIFDIVYTPFRTPLVVHAKKIGARNVPGYLMLLYQAALQFELFTGHKAPVHLMESELLRELRRRNHESK